MCGIVGYLGPREAQDVIISGLKKLEYRGYDSAGIAVVSNSETQRVRAQGKLIKLEEKLKESACTGHIGIGHTRWATHGAPSERNAHPHFVRGISLVHNGIIENYQEIKSELIAQGAKIESDTDSELVAHLIANEMEKSKDLFFAVKKILPKLEGAFSILVLSEKNPNELLAFKDGPPLVVGIGQKENFIASDVQALVQYTKDFFILEDREIVRVSQDQIEIYSKDGKIIKREPMHIQWNSEMVEKQGFSHFMLKEIYEQPRAIAAAVEPHIDRQKTTINLKLFWHEYHMSEDALFTEEILQKAQKILILACGTSYYAACVAKYALEELARIPVEVDIASEFRYRNPILTKETLVFTISQSGETADTLAALRLAKSAGLKVISLCNVKDSSIDREAHGHLYMNAGPEIGVASTKAFTSTLSVLTCFAVAVAQAKNTLNNDEIREITRNILALPAQVEVVLAFDKYFAEASESLKKFKGFLYMGRGINFPIAMEGALKMKELAYMHAEGYAAGEMKHGPLALIDEDMAIIMLAPKDSLFEKTLSNLEEARARGGRIISIGTGEDTKLNQISDYYLPLPKAHWLSNPILEVVPLQLMAFHLACHLGYDVDQPRNLAKSVTVE